MTRKPIAVEIAMPSGPAHYWREMLARADGFTIREIALCSDGVAYLTVKRYVHFLKKEGFIVRVGKKRDGFALQAVFAVRKRVNKAPIMRREPLKAPITAQQAMWNAMRVLVTFTIKELAFSASTEDRAVASSTADIYVRRLLAAGILERIENRHGLVRSGGGSSPCIYRLLPVANTGPEAPKLLKAGFVFDMNKRRQVGEAIVTEACS